MSQLWKRLAGGLGILTFGACTLNSQGTLVITPGDGGTGGTMTGSGGTAGDGGIAVSGGSGGAGAGGGGIAGGGAGGGGGSPLGGGGAGGAPPDPTSCAEVVGTNGIYTIDPDGAGGGVPFEAYCEQFIAGGGWTLIARSEAGAGSNFGWGVKRGIVSGTAPYSLDPVAAGLTIDVLLVVTRDDGIQAYTIDLPANFVADYDQSAWNASANVTHEGDGCVPGGGGTPTMLRYAGYTARNDVFFFRDNSSDDIIFGLFADGFQLNDGQCDKGGGLHHKQGELFIR